MLVRAADGLRNVVNAYCRQDAALAPVSGGPVDDEVVGEFGARDAYVDVWVLWRL